MFGVVNIIYKKKMKIISTAGNNRICHSQTNKINETIYWKLYEMPTNFINPREMSVKDSAHKYVELLIQLKTFQLIFQRIQLKFYL